MPNLIPLPKGDLWSPPTFDTEGNIVPRADNIDPMQALPSAHLTGDARKIAMDELMKSREVAEIITMVGGKVEQPLK